MRNLFRSHKALSSRRCLMGDVPIGTLDACGQGCTDTSSGTNADSPLEHRRCMTNSGYSSVRHCPVGQRKARRTELELPCPYSLGRVHHKTLCEVALDTTYHIVVAGFATLTNDSKSMVLHNRGPTDSPEKALLHPAVKAENCYSRRRLTGSMLAIVPSSIHC